MQGAEAEVLFSPGIGNNALSISREQLVAWIEKGANVVANYYHGFPVSKLSISITPRFGGGVRCLLSSSFFLWSVHS